RRWLLISRELNVPDATNSMGRWSLDHLFLDQDGIPTLVEVKRSTDTRARREVVAQMLDYAANGLVYWNVDDLKLKFSENCLKSGKTADEILNQILPPSLNIESYWQTVKNNLD